MRPFPRHLPLSAALLAVLVSCSGDSPTGTGPSAAQIHAVSGNGQAGVTQTTLPTPLVVRVTDARGNGVAGVTVSWTLDAAGGTLGAASTPTDPGGEARTEWTLGPAAGTFTVTATAPGVSPVTFTATAVVPQPARVDRAGGDAQAAVVATAPADSLAVRVTSAEGRPVPGVRVSWAVSAGGGTLSDSARVTDAAGLSKVRWTLGTAAGAQAVEARVSGLAGPPVVFRATAQPGSATAVAKVGGDLQNGTVGFALAAPLVVRVTDAFGNPVPGAGVTWISTGGGGSLSPAIATTDSLGTSRATWTMGITPGGHSATAAAAGATVSFGAVAALPAPVATVTVSPATATVRMGDTLRLAATPRDAAGNAVPGRSVSWSTSGPTLASVSAAGTVTGRAVGTATITATVDGHSGKSVVTVVTAPDTVPPKLKGFSASVAAVDVTSAPAQVEFTISAEDALSEIGTVHVNVIHRVESAVAYGSTYCYGSSPVTGTFRAGTWKCAATIPRGAPAGTWKYEVWLRDVGGNSVVYRGADLHAAGYPDTLVVANSKPAGPPTLTGLSLSSAAVDVSESAATVDALVSATTSRGLRSLNVALQNLRRSQSASCDLSVPASDTTTSGTWKCRLTIPRSAAAGAWEVTYVNLSDRADTHREYRETELRSLGFAPTLKVTSNTEDVSPPTLTAFSLSPATLDLSAGGKSVEFTITAADAETGMRRASVSLRAPNTPANHGSSHSCSSSVLDGTAKTATMKCSIFIAQSSVEGTWLVDAVWLFDAVGNYTAINTERLRAAGFPTTLTVTR